MNIEKFKVGDIVEATDGDNKLRGEIKRSSYGNLYVGTGGLRASLWTITEQGWELALIKAATLPLPTVPGIYADRNGSAWSVGSDGDLCYLAAVPLLGVSFERMNDRAADFAPFTLLAPVSA